MHQYEQRDGGWNKHKVNDYFVRFFDLRGYLMQTLCPLTIYNNIHCIVFKMNDKFIYVRAFLQHKLIITFI